MLQIIPENIFDSFQTIASELDADIQVLSEFSTILTLQNKSTEGEIRLLQIFSGVYAILFDLSVKEKITFTLKTTDSAVISCLYHRSGKVSHKSDFNIEYNKIEILQNIIIANNTEQNDHLIFEGDRLVQLNMIIMVEDLLVNTEDKEIDIFKSSIYKLFTELHQRQSYRYFGQIRAQVLEQLEFLIENRGTDTLSLMMNKAATLMLLARQFFFQEQFANNSDITIPLKRTEIEKIAALKEYIVAHLGHQITINKLIEISGLNSKKIRSGFRYLFNSTPQDYTTKLRIKKAVELLDTTDKNISEISYEIGFSNRSYFSSLFQKYIGMLPKQYRSSDKIKNSLYQLSYKSVAKPGITQADIDDILNSSYRNNGDRIVTGCLIYDFKEFFQILEGKKEDVLFIYQKIKEDSRHLDIKVLQQDLTEERYFTNFSMANLNAVGNTKIEQLLTIYKYHSNDINRTSKKNTSDFWVAIKKLLLTI
ncbi:BLUF domain-containing protein [Aquimarina sp. ERC-38]|uniref:BLUF domain-containing protein n=1 Tax=Aquimarina sp. ERC-38 TaxID=2949996 RepID=UPI0022476FA4|nr:BLUF domain-containing protein [Aquimarina sp. ERC-38]UZO82273.1 BLUF domain-containing protein [Aquimarina sp. ERC-38]